MMAVNIGILLISVCILIITACILSYLKIIFQRILKEDEDHATLNIINRIQDLESAMIAANELLRENAESNKPVANQLSNLENSLQSIIRLTEAQSENIELILQKIRDCDTGSNESPAIKLDKVAYDDAVIAFNNANDAIFGIRKHKAIARKLLDMLYSGHKDITEADYLDFDEYAREKIKSVESKIDLFNKSYRSAILDALKALGTSWERCVRFPLNKEFDNDWDENILGLDMDDTTIIDRVMALGFEFPSSIVIGRTKTKIA